MALPLVFRFEKAHIDYLLSKMVNANDFVVVTVGPEIISYSGVPTAKLTVDGRVYHKPNPATPATPTDFVRIGCPIPPCRQTFAILSDEECEQQMEALVASLAHLNL